MNQFYNVFNSVLNFFENRDEELRTSKNDLAYLTNLFKIFIGVNLQLQGDELNLINTKTVTTAFVGKLLMFKRYLGIGECSHFSILSEVSPNQ